MSNHNSQAHRATDVAKKLKHAANDLSLANIHQRDDILDQTQKLLAVIEPAVDQLTTLAAGAKRPRDTPPAVYLDDQKSAQSLANALYLHVQGNGSCRLTVKELRDAVCKSSPAAEQRYWLEKSGEAIANMLRHGRAVSMLHDCNATIWEGKQDQCWRLVNLDPSLTRAEIYDLVNGMHGGSACRFCGIDEGQETHNELQLLPGTGVSVHNRCSNGYYSLHKIAGPFRSREDAAAADLATVSAGALSSAAINQ